MSEDKPMESKEELLVSLKKLKERVSELIEKKEKRKNICWWDMEDCPFYLEMKGFENAGFRCCGCSHLDEERLLSILEDILPDHDFSDIDEQEAKEDAWKEKGKKEAEKELCEEIAGEIDEILEELD